MKKYNKTRAYFNLNGEELEPLQQVLRWVRKVRMSDEYEDYTEEEQDIFITIEDGIEQLFDHIEWDED
jgi:hypothetical protein